MKKEKSDCIEVFCMNCQAEHHLSLEDSMKDQEIRCSACGTINYWFICPECGTGFSRISKDKICPDCHGGEIKALSGKRFSFPPFEQGCPWCHEPVNLASFIVLKKTIGTCPSCKKHFGIKGIYTSLFYYLIFSIIAACIFKYVLKKYLGPAFEVTAIAVVIFGGFTVFLQSLTPIKYK